MVLSEALETGKTQVSKIGTKIFLEVTIKIKIARKARRHKKEEYITNLNHAPS
jgi:hypothetical protein